MKKMKKSTVYTVQGALIAAVYAALTYAVAPLSFGATQFRISEALTILPVFTPAAIPGLAIGCVIANIGSPFGPIDIVLGTLATLLSDLVQRNYNRSGNYDVHSRTSRYSGIFLLRFGRCSRRGCCMLHARSASFPRTGTHPCF